MCRWWRSVWLDSWYKGLAKNVRMEILENQICFPATRQPDGHFRDLFSCTILTKDFPEIGSKLPGCRDFIPAEGEHVAINGDAYRALFGIPMFADDTLYFYSKKVIH